MRILTMRPPRRAASLALAAFIFIAAIGAGWALTPRDAGGAALLSTGGEARPEPGYRAPDFALRTLDGGEVALSDYRGAPVAVNFYASWCVPCEDEMPLIAAAARDGERDGYRVLPVAVRDDAGAALGMLEDYGLGDVRAGNDPRGTVQRAWRVIGPPATFFIDADGVVRDAVRGPVNEESLARGVSAMRSAKSAAATSDDDRISFGAVGLILAAAAGALSFLSPCVVPLLPAYLSYISGVSVGELREAGAGNARRVATRTLAFIGGLSVVMMLLGASATALGRGLYDHQSTLAKAGGVLIIVLGIQMAGLLRLEALAGDRRIDFTRFAGRGAAGAMVMGAAFAFGWTPCIGPMLAAILALAAQADTVGGGMALLLAYGLGLGVPFLALGMLAGWGLRFARGVGRHGQAMSLASGAMLLAMGVLVFSGRMTQLSTWMTEAFGTGFAV